MSRAMGSFLALAAALTVGGLLRAQSQAPAGKPIADRELGLSEASVFEVPSPPKVVENLADPGELPVLPRAYPGAPPLISHGVADFLPITREDNLCVDCHQIAYDGWEQGDPTPIAPSHYTDLRRGFAVGEKIVGARWVCVTCHIPAVDAPPLVKNRFAQAKKPAAAEKD